VLAALALTLAGCADTGYLWQSVRGHLAVLRATRPLPDWVQDPTTPAALRDKLLQAQAIRQYASRELHLPDNASYTRYADIDRPFVVWNVVAAPPYSLSPKTWCFPVAGCVAYRGYFAQAHAQALAAQLKAQGLEVWVYGVPAYSTLGRLNVLGGDPLLNTWVAYPRPELARLMFHELAHQVLYVAGDTRFNESFATWVERQGSAQWLAQRATPDERSAFAVHEQRRMAFAALARRTRVKLHTLYESFDPQAPVSSAQAAMKSEIMAGFRADYAKLKSSWGGYAGYDPWVAGANNAAFAMQAAYDDWVTGFGQLWAQQGSDWPRFFDAVRALAAQPAPARSEQLQRWTQEATGG
jgi:predicted aminopeptidase